MADQTTRPTRTDSEELLDLLWPDMADSTSSLTPDDFVTLVEAISEVTGTDLQVLVDETVRAAASPS